MEGLNIGIIGLGTVGSGCVEILLKNKELVRAKAGGDIRIKKIADLDITRDRGLDLEGIPFVTEAMEIIQDKDIQVVVELIGGTTKAREYAIEAIKKGKHLVTANKALLAETGSYLFDLAKENNVFIGFEASVAGGIPIITAVKDGLCANFIRKLMAILNGTSNYILTQMQRHNKTYEEVVNEAVRLGFAEDPPTLDVNGTDVSHKLIILLALFYGKWFSMDQIYKEGIERITPQDLIFADEFGYKVKLLAIAKAQDEELEARVHPVMIPKAHMLAGVDEAYNGIYIEGDFVGPTLFYGLGAGRRPTGSAVVSDLIAIARKVFAGQREFPYGLGSQPLNGKFKIKPIEEVSMPYYFRFQAQDKPGVLSKISGILAHHQISIASVIQKGRVLHGSVPIVMLTHEAKESAVRKAIREIDKLDVVSDATVAIRVEGDAAEN